jgi:hypothetical protein
MLARSPGALSAFPFLRSPPPKVVVHSKSCCGSGRTTVRRALPRDFTATRAQVAQLPPADMDKFLGFLGAPAVRVVFRAPSGTMQDVTRVRSK